MRSVEVVGLSLCCCVLTRVCWRLGCVGSVCFSVLYFNVVELYCVVLK